jgi:hypothetical protein
MYSELEVKGVFGQPFMDELSKLAQSLLLSQNQNLVNCSCGNIMEVVPGAIDYKTKDDIG